MRKYLVRYCCLIVFFIKASFLLSQNCNKGVKTNWELHKPFEQGVFIENPEGQFENKNKEYTSKILFYTRINGLDIYFTSSGITYRHVELPARLSDKDYEIEGATPYSSKNQNKPKESYFSVKWQITNYTVQVIPEEAVKYYYTYPQKNGSTIIAHAFKKLLYKNLYPGIDMEYAIKQPEMALEYTIIAHPGADISLIKMQFNDAESLLQDTQGNIIIQSTFGQFTNNIPAKTFYAENNLQTTSKLLLNGNTAGFYAEYDHNKTLIIDPIIINPFFSASEGVYDIDYDWQGNIYGYGSNYPYQLIKLNSNGVIQWIANSISNLNNVLSYGDFCVDKSSGDSYIAEGISLANRNIIKLNTNGVLVDSLGIYIGEMWRLEYNACLGKIIIGGGGTRSLMGILDTSLTNCDTVNIIGTLNCCHDVCLMTLDNYSNNCYFALAKAGFGNTDTSYNNYLIKCPASTLTPATFILPDGYSFLEYGIPYVPTNAMNGMAASPDWLYLYDGAVLKRFDKNTGALKSSKSISSTSQYWGGLDVDLCNNIYLANNKTIEILDSNENNTGSILAPDTVYDLLLASSNLLAGGNGFIASYPVTAPSIGLSIAKTPASSCNTCDGIAKAIVKSCSTDTSLFSYNWSDGQTNRIATGLCFGNYTVTVSVGCDIKYSDTVNISALPTGGIVLTTLQKNESCYGDSNASITVNATGGTTPYTYIWMPGGSTSATLSSLTTGTYSVVVKDSAGCADAIISVTQPLPILIDKSSITSISCYGGKDGCINVNANGGASPYTYVWLSTSSDSSFACNLSTGTYSVSVTDANGCNKIDSFFIPQPPQIMVSTVSPVSIYTGQTTTISASASGGTAPYAYVWQAFFNGSSISVSPADTTVYEVTATDANGCQGTAYVTVDVLPSCEIFVPDAFSPNGDGQNDVLYVRGSQCIQSLDFVIYDRWGNKIFETQNLSDGWDGKYLGQPMNTGTYAYYLRAYTLLNTLVSQEGNITLIR